MDAEEAKRRRTAGRADPLSMLPAVRLQGPLPVTAPAAPAAQAPAGRAAVGRGAALDDPEATPLSPPREDDESETSDGGAEIQLPLSSLPRIIANAPAFILHMYSGRRRRGDMQDWLEKADLCLPGREIRVVSVDVAIDPVQGNLCDPTAIQAWLRRIRDGYVVGAVGGPPCETWSRVRGCGAGPPKLRSAVRPWGLAARTPAQLLQLRVATLLLHAFLLVFVALLRAGGAAVLEHPAEPPEEDFCSIWRLAVTRALRRHPDVSRVYVEQGPLGQVSTKPTHLLTLRVPTLTQHLDALADPSWRPQPRGLGKNSEGEWKTAVLKEYPPQMCRAFALALRDAVASATTWPAVGPVDDVCATLSALVMPLGDGEMGADFAKAATAALPEHPVAWESLAEETVCARELPHGLQLRARKRRLAGRRLERPA